MSKQIGNVGRDNYKKEPRRIFLFLRFYLFLERRERREKERETDIDVREKHGSVASRMPQTETEPVTQACALTGDGTSDLSLCRTMSN